MRVKHYLVGTFFLGALRKSLALRWALAPFPYHGALGFQTEVGEASQ